MPRRGHVTEELGVNTELLAQKYTRRKREKRAFLKILKTRFIFNAASRVGS